MKNYLQITLLCLFMYSCSASKTSSAFSVIPDSIATSNHFKMFWNELSENTDGFKKLQEYRPTVDQISKYNLQKDGENYLATGFFKTNKALTNKEIKNFKGAVTVFSENMYAFRVKINNIQDLVKTEGIVYIELSSKVRLKK